MFFLGKKNHIKEAKREAQIQDIRKDMFRQIDKKMKPVDKLSKLLDNKEELGITEMIFLATGGNNRHGR